MLYKMIETTSSKTPFTLKFKMDSKKIDKFNGQGFHTCHVKFKGCLLKKNLWNESRNNNQSYNNQGNYNNRQIYNNQGNYNNQSNNKKDKGKAHIVE